MLDCVKLELSNYIKGLFDFGLSTFSYFIFRDCRIIRTKNFDEFVQTSSQYRM